MNINDVTENLRAIQAADPVFVKRILNEIYCKIDEIHRENNMKTMKTSHYLLCKELSLIKAIINNCKREGENHIFTQILDAKIPEIDSDTVLEDLFEFQKTVIDVQFQELPIVSTIPSFKQCFISHYKEMIDKFDHLVRCLMKYYVQKCISAIDSESLETLKNVLKNIPERKWIIDHICDTDYGYNLLHYALYNATTLEIIEYLVEYGFDPHKSDGNGDTSLHLVCNSNCYSSSRRMELAKYLLNTTKVSINSVNGQITPLYHSVESDDNDMIEFLISQGAIVSSDVLSLCYSRKRVSTKVFQLLMDNFCKHHGHATM